MNDDTQLIEIAKAAKAINDEKGITVDDAFELILDGIHKIPETLQMMLDSVVSMQGEFPMPRASWEAFARDIEYTNDKHGLNLMIKPELLKPHNTATQAFADLLLRSIKTLEDDNATISTQD